MHHLTERQQSVYTFMLSYFLEHQRIPPIRTIGERFDLSRGTIRSCQDALIRKGWLVNPRDVCRDRDRYSRLRFATLRFTPVPLRDIHEPLTNGV